MKCFVASLSYKNTVIFFFVCKLRILQVRICGTLNVFNIDFGVNKVAHPLSKLHDICIFYFLTVWWLGCG